MTTGGREGGHVAWATHCLELSETANAGFLPSPSESSSGGSVDARYHADVASCFVVLTLIDAQGVDLDISCNVRRSLRMQDRYCGGVELEVFPFVVR